MIEVPCWEEVSVLRVSKCANPDDNESETWEETTPGRIEKGKEKQQSLGPGTDDGTQMTQEACPQSGDPLAISNIWEKGGPSRTFTVDLIRPASRELCGSTGNDGGTQEDSHEVNLEEGEIYEDNSEGSDEQ
ncbi:hypothetical protein Syun_025988 [Stephania yunnanensis]|uniref:Uncharacterized protein n=1 Tax=Stephania yunnanensis TaxID=152371 RepID=A0AAP0EY62_9MAGN